MLITVKQAFQQSRECNSKSNDPMWPVFERIRNSIHVQLICKFQVDPIKTERVMSMRISYCHSNQDFHRISMKSFCHCCPTRGMLQMRNDWGQPAIFGDITGQRCWRTTKGRRMDHCLTSSPGAFGPGVKTKCSLWKQSFYFKSNHHIWKACNFLSAKFVSLCKMAAK